MIERFRPIVETLTQNEDGKRDLAAICAFYLKEHQPETTVTEPSGDGGRGDAPRDERAHEGPRKRKPRKRRRR